MSCNCCGKKSTLAPEQSLVLGRRWHRHGSTAALRMCEGGTESAYCAGTDAERVVLLLLKWQQQEGEKPRT
jgi:hypothetical protein